MPNGGWGHFEGGKGLSRVKHPCFTQGDGLSGRDTETPDLFDLVDPCEVEVTNKSRQDRAE